METKLARWESAVATWPNMAATYGPPNWLVCEEWKGKDKEPFEDAAQRVRERYFPSAPKNVHTPVSAPVRACKTCTKDMGAQRGLECYACQKRRQRF